MKAPTHEFFMGARFERFLHEPIGEDSNGMRLTVLSALARLDLDPWEEAATLARLPGIAAARKLALLLAELPERLLGGADSGTVALRLISLLPGRLPAEAPSRSRPTPVAAAERPPVVGSLILYAMLMLLMFTGEWLITHAHAPPAAAIAGPGPAATAAEPSSAIRPVQ